MLNVQFSTKFTSYAKKQESMSHTQEKSNQQKLTEEADIALIKLQISYLKYIQRTNKTMSKELKENMITMPHKTENIKRQKQQQKRNSAGET